MSAALIHVYPCNDDEAYTSIVASPRALLTHHSVTQPLLNPDFVAACYVQHHRFQHMNKFLHCV